MSPPRPPFRFHSNHDFLYNISRNALLIYLWPRGTGASCIYPLLATRQRQNWRLVGTDIDDKSLEYADRNVARNGLVERVRLIKVDKDEALVPREVLERFGKYVFPYGIYVWVQEICIYMLISAPLGSTSS